MVVRRRALLLAIFIALIIIPTQSVGAIATKTDSKYQNGAVEGCSQSVVPQLSQARLYAAETQITTEEQGRISGEFQAPANIECPIRVVVTLSVPSGTGISGWGSGGSGLIQTSFNVEPEEVQSISADVSRSQPGKFTITGDITYWPAGLKNQSRQIDGISLTFQSTSTSPSPETPTPPPVTPTPPPADRTDFGIGLLLLFITTTIVLRMVLYSDSDIKLKIKEEDIDLKDLIALIAAIFGILATLYTLLVS
ncbi:hypothetical protein [Halorussus pelagicus]|uniref:hypothetical protein n=1 Tax=Halorussus pelagicus TaxID=2505977 RepID=UPI000FFCA3F3|nr:hypothetical protein [Halorussus pelagicus]